MCTHTAQLVLIFVQVVNTCTKQGGGAAGVFSFDDTV